MSQIQTNLYLGSCASVLNELESQPKFRLVLTSTPYPGLRGFSVTWDAYWGWAYANFWHIKQHMDEQGSMLLLVINARNKDIPHLFDFYRYLWTPLGFEHNNLYIWDKLNAPPSGNLRRYDHSMWEFIFALRYGPKPRYKPYREPYVKSGLKGDSAKDRKPSVYGNMAGGHTELHPEGARQGNVLRLSPSGGREVDRPRAKGGSFPITLAERYIHQFSEPGDWVLDPFCGAGTTLYAAKRMGRNSVGIEIDEDTYEKARGWVLDNYEWDDNLPHSEDTLTCEDCLHTFSMLGHYTTCPKCGHENIS